MNSTVTVSTPWQTFMATPLLPICVALAIGIIAAVVFAGVNRRRRAGN